MNTHVPDRTHFPWHVGNWFARIHRLLGKIRGRAPCAPAAPLTRRQQLAAAQDLKKYDQRLREIALLRKIKRGGRGDARGPRPLHRITGN